MEEGEGGGGGRERRKKGKEGREMNLLFSLPNITVVAEDENVLGQRASASKGNKQRYGAGILPTN